MVIPKINVNYWKKLECSPVSKFSITKNNSSGKIKLKKHLVVNMGKGLEIDGLTIFTKSTGNRIGVSFVCSYSATATTSSSEINLEPGTGGVEKCALKFSI